MKLTHDDIKYVDRWLQFSGINYLDVRYELVDHLISEYEQRSDDISLDSFVKERLCWCKLTAKKKERVMHWGIQKALWKRFLSLLIEAKIILPLVLYIVIMFNLKNQFSPITIRLLFLAPVFLTVILFVSRSIFKRFDREKQKHVLAMTKLGSLFAIPQLFLSIFYWPAIWTDSSDYLMDNHYFTIPCMAIMTLINIAAIREYDDLYEKIVKEYEFIKGSS